MIHQFLDDLETKVDEHLEGVSDRHAELRAAMAHLASGCTAARTSANAEAPADEEPHPGHNLYGLIVRQTSLFLDTHLFPPERNSRGEPVRYVDQAPLHEKKRWSVYVKVIGGILIPRAETDLEPTPLPA